MQRPVVHCFRASSNPSASHSKAWSRLVHGIRRSIPFISFREVHVGMSLAFFSQIVGAAGLCVKECAFAGQARQWAISSESSNRLKLRGGGKCQPEPVGGRDGAGFGKQVHYCRQCGVPPEYCEAVRCPRIGVQKEPSSATALGSRSALSASNATEGLDLKDLQTALEMTSNSLSGDGDGVCRGSPMAVENGKSCTAKLRKQDRKQSRDSRTNVVVKLAKRGRRKHVTTITGLDVHLPLAVDTRGVVGTGETLKDIAKLMANKFALGASVVQTPDGSAAISLQGDVVQHVCTLLQDLGVPAAIISAPFEKD